MALPGTHCAPSPALLGLREGLNGLFFTSLSSSSSSSSSNPSPQAHRLGAHAGLPLELFLRIIESVRFDTHENDDGDDVDGEEEDLVRCSHVCSGWRKAIVGCGRLWRELEVVKVCEFAGVERARAIGQRSKGCLRLLTLNFSYSGDIPLASLPIVVMLKQILREISTHDGARQLREFELDLKPLRYMEDLEVPYRCIALATQFAEYSAVNLKTLRILTALDRFPSGAPFFFALPSLHKLVVSSSQFDNGATPAMLPDFFQTTATIEAAQVSACQLAVLTLSGTSMMDGNFADFPCLRVVKLCNVKVSNLYGFLSKCADTLEVLWLRGVTSDPSNRFLPPPAGGGGIKDLPPVLPLPALKDLQICGWTTPHLFIAPKQDSAHFVVSTPILKRVSFARQNLTESDSDDEADYILPSRSLTAAALSTLFRTAGLLTHLDLTGTNVTDEMLIAALPYASASLSHLRIGETSAAKDALVERLASLAPQLTWLDVYSRPDFGFEGKVSVQALARFAKRMKGLSPTRRWMSDWELTLVTTKPYEPDPTLSSLRQTLRNLLVTLTPSQLDHLISSSLVLNPPPSSLPYEVVRAELLALGTPPPPAGTGTGGTTPLVAGQPQQEKERKKKKAKQLGAVPVPQATVDAAAAALVAWQTRREEEAAVQWCEKEDGVELVWGKAGCGLPGCECEKVYPGWDDWHEGEDEDR
ncbi:hypothetical protein JCM10207_005375 [Rhodosporidiobolus poonsookiae]